MINFHSTKLRKFNNYGRGWSFDLFLKVHIISAIDVPMVECNAGKYSGQKYFTYNGNYYKVDSSFFVDQIQLNEIPLIVYPTLLTPPNK